MSGDALWWPDLAAGPAALLQREGAGHEERVQAVAASMVGGTVFTLSRVEQLLLWSARRWRHGRFRWEQVELEFRRLLPGGWADALLAWEEVLEQLHHYPASRPDIGNGCRSALSTDERTLLTLVSVLQRPGGRVTPRLLLSHLVAPARQRDLAGPLLALAATLSMGGVLLPLQGPVPATAAGRGFPCR